ncbi:hypothetical protein CAS74_001468 [Pichia kudriavzevii]|uniref:Vps41 beta-propeller domain-containing protein n=1 Tax=Pichia kudriavzevii TaxID=4909 RepID=A0A1Z8JRF4_PICKU|nr:uncharacterized protein C5L36_0A02670 [Pichia kudriavzevii]AWU73664.1 hypothetical protein C5L36_0A02670 [Pichia kudriavzevii]OUT23156.1 hypothetical protein CAS74_001468 [Pichia kudriavzevii]
MSNEEPPYFRYKRVTSLPERFFTTDPISASFLSEEYAIFGTHSGMLLITTSTTFKTLKIFKGHTASVLDIDFDGQTFAAASMDGTILIGDINQLDNITKYDFKRPLHAVSLQKPYSKTKSFYSGGKAGDLVYTTRNWLNQRTDEVLFRGNCITMIKYGNDRLIWCDSAGIYLKNLSSGQLLKLKAPVEMEKSELYWPKLDWSDDKALTIGWFNSMWKIDVAEMKVTWSDTSTDYLIASIATYSDGILILNYTSKTDGEYYPPDLILIDQNGDEIVNDELPIREYENLNVNDYGLLRTQKSWLLICPNDAVSIEPLWIGDRINWYVQREEFKKAWELGESMNPYQRLDIGLKEWKKNKDVEFFKKLLNGLNNLEYSNHLVNELNVIYSKYVSAEMLPSKPYSGEKQIDPKYYDQVLNELLYKQEYDQFVHYLHQWDHTLFSVGDICSHMGDILESEDVPVLRDAYISLSLELEEPENCVKHYIALKDPQLLEFLDSHHLLDRHFQELPLIIYFGVPPKKLEENVEILINNVHEILPQRIIKLFKDNQMDHVNYIYLNKLRKVDPLKVKDFEDEIVSLFAKFNKEELFDFLQVHSKYSIENAIRICENNQCYKELVYLLSKVGENKKALILIIDKMNDPGRAIEFVQSVNEKNLWDFLLDYSMNKPEFVKELLMNVGKLVDPIPVVSRIPVNVKIDGLKGALIDITRNVTLDKKIYDLVMDIISDEYMSISEALRKLKMMGYIVDKEELELVRSDMNHTYIKLREENTEKFGKEEDILGAKWDGDLNNKMGHKSFLQYKIM